MTKRVPQQAKRYLQPCALKWTMCLYMDDRRLRAHPKHENRGNTANCSYLQYEEPERAMNMMPCFFSQIITLNVVSRYIMKTFLDICDKKYRSRGRLNSSELIYRTGLQNWKSNVFE